MKYYSLTFALFIFFFYSCVSNNKKELLSSLEKNKLPECIAETCILADEFSSKNDIIVSYSKHCYIDSLFIQFKLDERSFEKHEKYELNKIIIEVGYLGNDQIIFQKVTDDFHINENNVVTAAVGILGKKIDAINLITIQSLGTRNELSHLYINKNSLELLEIQNTYLDYKAFIRTNTQFKNISSSQSKIDSLLVTVKANKSIDDITKYKITINDTHVLNFRNSIRADYKHRKTQDKNSTMYHLLKMNKNFCTFKLNLSKLNLDKLNTLKVSVD